MVWKNLILKPSKPHVRIIKIEIESKILQPEGTQSIRDFSRYHLSPKRRQKNPNQLSDFMIQGKSEFYHFLKDCEIFEIIKTATKGNKLRPRLLIETSNWFYFCPFIDCGAIQKLNKAWHNSTKFHLITQFFRHPQNNRKISLCVARIFNVFRFSLKEIGNLLGRLAICRFLFNCPFEKSNRSPHFRISFCAVETRGCFSWTVICGSQSLPKSFEKFPRAAEDFKETSRLGIRDLQFMTATHSGACLFEGAELWKSRSVWN